MEKAFTVYEVERHEYKKDYTYMGQDENDEPIMNEKLAYTGKIIHFLGRDKAELLDVNSIPEWKAKVTGEYNAILGHNANGQHKFLFNGAPITLL